MNRDDYLNYPFRYIESFYLNDNKKKRFFATYRTDKRNLITPEGKELQDIHKQVLDKLNNKLNIVFSSKNSFAYRKGKSSKDSFDSHLKSIYFYKIDIKKFFESITFNEFVKIVDCSKYNLSEDNLFFCFYENRLPLGYKTSPILSQLYLNDFDTIIDNYIHDKNLHYSRYCDDILISSENSIDDLELFKKLIIKELSKNNLSINDVKVKFYDLSDKSKQKYVKFLGLNLIRDNSNKYFITVSKSYIVGTIRLFKKSQFIRNVKYRKYLIKVAKARAQYIKDSSIKSFDRFKKKYRNIKWIERDLINLY